MTQCLRYNVWVQAPDLQALWRFSGLADSCSSTLDGGKPEKKRLRPRALGRTKGGLNAKLHMVSDGRGQPLNFPLSPGRMSDAKGRPALLAGMPTATRLIGDKG